MIESAVILAAGMGTRLKGEAGDRPKGFLQFGEQPIIEESIQCLTGAGIRDIVIVTGHGSEFYDALAADRDGLVRTVHNAAFAESGSMYSLACAKDLVKGSFLLLESDLIYEPRALSELLAVPDEDAILLSGPTDAGDEVFVATLDGHLVDMSKDREALLANRGARITGELVGISRISQPLFEIMLRLAGKVFESSLMYDYETDCLVAAARERDIACPLVPDLAWAEIDDPDHLRRAREDVYPEIRRLTTKN
jgi:choline kinase